MVRDTGFEPVTPTVSRWRFRYLKTPSKPHGIWCSPCFNEAWRVLNFFEFPQGKGLI